MEVQQSHLYAQYVRRLGWTVEQIDGSSIFIKRFPLYGGFAKLQRCIRLPRIDHLLPTLSQHHVKQFAVEPDSSIDQNIFFQWVKQISSNLSIVQSPYLPTKTIRIDLTGAEEEIFQRFSEAKRRAVRRALKHHVLIRQSSDIHVLINVKNKSAGFLGFITTSGIDKLWQIFAPDHAAILLASHAKSLHKASPWHLQGEALSNSKIIGGVLLLFWDSIAYYWIAAATREGKKLFAPTLLVWEALKLSKQRGMKHFDFVGVWDERLPKQNKEWLGFTKFKEGFGGTALYYPIYTLPLKRTA